MTGIQQSALAEIQENDTYYVPSGRKTVRGRAIVRDADADRSAAIGCQYRVLSSVMGGWLAVGRRQET